MLPIKKLISFNACPLRVYKWKKIRNYSLNLPSKLIKVIARDGNFSFYFLNQNTHKYSIKSCVASEINSKNMQIWNCKKAERNYSFGQNEFFGTSQENGR